MHGWTRAQKNNTGGNFAVILISQSANRAKKPVAGGYIRIIINE
jgi:hypothetical protein